jgi:peptidoglycan hydrolase CwlO-like protein
MKKPLPILKHLLGILCFVIVLTSCQKQVDYAPQIQSLTNSISTLQSALNNSLASLQKSRDSLATALALTNTNISATNNNVTALSKSMDSVNTALLGINSKLSNLSLRIDTANTQIATLNTQMKAANANISSINDQIVKINASILNFTDLINLLNQEYNDLLVKLNTLLLGTTISNGLVAYYPFNGNVLDYSGNGNNGSIVNTITYGADHNSILTSALNLGSGRVTTNTSMFGFQYTDAFTVSFWFQNGGSASGRLISTENTEGNFRIASYGNGVYAYAFGGMPYLYDTVALNTWTHISFVYSNRNISLYKNGVLKTTATNSTTELLHYGTPFTIGEKAAASFDDWTGKIDELRLYNRAITSQEANYIYTH